MVSRNNRVVLSDNLVVPSRHEIVVQCLVEIDTPEELESLTNQPCIFECDHLGNDEDRISVLGIVRDDRFPVRICNLLPHDLALRKNQSLGTLVDEPVVGTLSKEDDCTGGGTSSTTLSTPKGRAKEQRKCCSSPEIQIKYL